MTDCKTYEEMTLAAERLVAGMAPGTPIILKSEPDNPMDPMAVAAYYDYTQQIGYVSSEQTCLVHPLLNAYGEADTVVSGSAGHVTLEVMLPEGGDLSRVTLPKERKHRIIPDAPFARGVRLSHGSLERSLEVVAHRFLDKAIAPENLPTLAAMAEKMLPLTNLSLCCEDSWYTYQVHSKLKLMTDLAQMCHSTELCRLQGLTRQMEERVADLHRAGGHQQIWEAQLERLQRQTEGCEFYTRYDLKHLGSPLPQADGQRMEAEVARLRAWLTALPCELGCCFASDTYRRAADSIFYHKVLRDELTDIASVVLVLRRLEAERARRQQLTPTTATGEELPAELATPRAMECWRRLQEGGLVDDRYQPLASATERAVLAYEICERLGLGSRWAIFEKMWSTKWLNRSYNRALEQKKTLAYRDMVKSLLNE